MATNKQPTQTLVHFTSSSDGLKSLELEVVKPGSASAQFLKRMENHHKDKPCYRVIDLRQKDPGDLFEYEYHGIVHFLNSSSIELFEELLPKYHYVYTQQIYDLVIANFKPVVKTSSSIKKNAIVQQHSTKVANPKNSSSKTSIPKTNSKKHNKLPKILAPVKIIPFGYHRHQNEIRMLYISPIQIHNNAEQESITAKTMNLSVSGLKIKVEQHNNFQENQTISVSFSELNKKLGKSYPAIDYEIVEIGYFDNHQVLRLIRIENQNDNAFISAVSKFIFINKRRYKIDLDDFIESVKSKYLEREYSQSSQHSSLFFHQESGVVELRHMLSNSLSEPDKRLVPILSEMKSAFSELNFNSESNSTSLQQVFINIYSFTIKNTAGDEILYSAVDSDFSNSLEKTMFLKLALANKSYQGWHLLIRPCQKLTETAATSYLSELEDVSIAEADKLKLEIETVFATGKIINNNQSSLPYSSQSNISNDEIQQFPYEKFECNEYQKDVITNIKVAQKKQRNENRYYLTTAVVVEVNGADFEGHTLDFSPNGVKIQLDNPLQAEHRDTADISFPGLQKKFKKEQLNKQHFRIAHISKNGKTICFSRDRRFVLHEASIFFRRLIDCNSQKLTQCSGDTYMVVRSALFEHLMTRNLLTIPFFIRLQNDSLKADYISVNEKSTALMWNFKTANGYDFDCIFASPSWRKIISFCSANTNQINVVYDTEIYLYKNVLKHNWQISIAEDFKNTSAKSEFIENLKHTPHRKIIKLSITPVANFDDEFIVDEIHEVRNNSKNQSDEFQKRLRSIKALGELVDISENYF